MLSVGGKRTVAGVVVTKAEFDFDFDLFTAGVTGAVGGVGITVL